MLKKLVGAIGWVGTVLVFAAVAIRLVRPEWMAGQWRDVV